jgi:hypothetical protein
VTQLAYQEPLISEGRKPQLKQVIQSLIAKLSAPEVHDFFLSKILRAHILPLTNCAFNKSGDKCVLPRCAVARCGSLVRAASRRCATGSSPAATIGRARCGIRRPATSC